MFGQLWDYHREVIKGQKHTLLSHWANLSQEGRRSLKELFAVNKRLNRRKGQAVRGTGRI